MYFGLCARKIILTSLLWIGNIILADDSSSESFVAVATSAVPLVSSTGTSAIKNGNQGLGGRPIDRGLQPLYTMTNTFLNLIQPNTDDDDLLNDSQLENVFNNENFEDSIEALHRSFTNNWQLWMKHYVSYSICIIVGIVFIVIMPFIGTCFFLCRCCGRCGSQRKQCSKRVDICKRSACGIFLIVFTTVLMAGMVCTFVTNDLLHEQTTITESQLNSSLSNSEFSVLPTVISSLQSLDQFRKDIIADLRDDVVSPIKQKINQISNQLTEFPEKARSVLSGMTNLDETLDAADELASSLENISLHLQLVQDYKNSLIDLQTRLNSSLNESKTNILTALPPECSFDPNCVKLRTEVRGLQVSVNFSQAEDLSNYLNSIQKVIDENFTVSIQKGKTSYKDLVTSILDQETTSMMNRVVEIQRGISNKSDEVLAVIQNVMNDVADILNAVNLQSAGTFVSGTITPKVNKYGNYRYYAGIGLSCILLLWVMFTYLGLCFGACGESLTEDTTACCNRGNGAKFLMVGVAFIFLFCWILMIVVVCLFALGGAVYTEACQPMINQRNSTLIKIGDKYIASMLNSTKVKVTIMGFLQDCQNNAGIYSALNLEPEMDLTGQFVHLENVIRSSFNDSISGIDPDLSSVEIMNTDTISMLNELIQSQLDYINFTLFDTLVSQPITNRNLLVVSDEIHNATLPYKSFAWAQKIDVEAANIRTLANTIVVEMQNISQKLQTTVGELHSEIQPLGNGKTFADRTQFLVDTLNNTQNFFRINGSTVIKQFIVGYVQEIFEDCVTFLLNLKSKIENDIFKCQPLYNTIMLLTTSVCQSFFNPFNGFWFSIGWCLFFSIPIIIISVKLAGLYRKHDDYYASDLKSYDDPLAWRNYRGYPR